MCEYLIAAIAAGVLALAARKFLRFDGAQMRRQTNDYNSRYYADKKPRRLS